jgi:hypothetical protein
MPKRVKSQRVRRKQAIRNVKLLIINAVLVVIAVFILHQTLPPDQVKDYTASNMDKSFLKMHPENALSFSYAQWRYTDYILIKYARSDVLGVTLIGSPFQMWKLYEID